MGTDSPRRHRHGPVAVGVLVLVLCALVAATFDGPRWPGLRDEPERVSTSEEAASPQDPDDPAPAEDRRSSPDDDEPWLPWVPPLDLLLLVPAALVLGVALLVAARLRLVRRRRRLTGRAGPRHSPAPSGPPPVEEDLDVPEALDEGARTIGEGAPRNAIVATWLRLERAVESDRFPHRPEETPSELVERALASYRLDGTAIRRLAALYREARFSAHPVTEDHRAEAADCLRRLLAALGSGAR